MAQTDLYSTNTAADAIDRLQSELEQCRRDLSDSRRRTSELLRAERLLAGENRILEAVARGVALPAILADLCRLIEEQGEEALCGILLFDPANNRVLHGAAPSLPQGYNDAIHGRTVTPEAGPCGLVVCRKEQVVAADIATDPRWETGDWRPLALSHGLRACWSTPILSCGGTVLGTFAIYWRNPRSPTPADHNLIEQTTHLAAVAIERRQIEEKLRRNESGLTEAIDTIPGLVWTSLPDGHIEYLNKRWLDYTGLRMEVATGWGWQVAIHQEDLPGLVAYWRTILSAGTPGEYEARLRRHDGVYRWFLFRGVPLHDAQNRLVKWYGTNTDVDDRKRADEAVRAAKARFEGILEIAEDAIIAVDSGQRIVLFNQGAEMVFGFAQAEVMGQPLDLLIPARFHAAHGRHVEDFGRSRDVSRVMGQRRELFGRRKTGEEFPAEASISKLDLGGELVFTVILRDITERKKAAEALRASEHLARGQLEALASSLAALSRESVPEKFLEHVLRIAAEQLEAVGISVWEMNERIGCVELAAIYQGGVLHVPARNEDQPPLRMTGAIAEHPVWTEFFRTGRQCVYGRIQNGPPWSEVAIHPDGPWHDWRAGMVDNPIVPQMIKDIAASGIVATLNVPMSVAGKVAGLFVLCFKQHRRFRPDEIELTRAMANQAMLAAKLMRLSQANRESAVVAERNRMARDLHDTLAQGFTGVIMQLEATKGAMVIADATSARAHIERAEALARASLGEARRSVRAMRSRSLVDGTLSTALDELLKRMTSGTELQAELVVQGEGRSLPPDWGEGLLRIAQESLTNTIKYARASRFRAALSFLPRAVRLQLVDDGRGFDSQAEHEGFGLVGMRERAGQMAGNFILRSKPGEGTEIVVELNQPNAGNGSHENDQA
jgi:PAS domain S-box-containing protein